jgi:hypothetical protein
MQMTETRQFSVSPNIIYSLIKAQAGSLGKAITECVMNSVDAFAKRVDIKVTSTNIIIKDDGIGFQTREEIEAWFETLGFDHSMEGNHRAFGAFGIGRAQLWSFAPTIWRTNQFTMDVDIKNKGLDYKLHETITGETTPGLTIEGTFYKPLSPAELITLEQDLRRQIRYVQVPVRLNGALLGVSTGAQDWDFETDDAWFKFEQLTPLEVFNMGVLVKHYHHYQYKVGGLVVTKPGVKLSLNMARNDILVADCPVWERIAKVLEANSSEPPQKPPKKEKVTTAQMALRVQDVLDNGNPNVDAFLDIRGRNRSLYNITRTANIVVVMDPKNDKAKRAHQLKLAVVLKPETLERFGCKTAAELQVVLAEAMTKCTHARWRDWVAGLRFFDSLKDALPTLDDRYETLSDSELTPVEVTLLMALNRTKNHIRQNAFDAKGAKVEYGGIRAGNSDVAKSWCMAGEITLERSVVKKATTSFSGFMAAMGYVLHEFAAGLVDSNVEHQHDVAFYEHLQSLWVDPKLVAFTMSGFAYFTRQCADKGIELHRTALAALEEIS